MPKSASDGSKRDQLDNETHANVPSGVHTVAVFLRPISEPSASGGVIRAQLHKATRPKIYGSLILTNVNGSDIASAITVKCYFIKGLVL